MDIQIYTFILFISIAPLFSLVVRKLRTSNPYLQRIIIQGKKFYFIKDILFELIDLKDLISNKNKKYKNHVFIYKYK